MVLTTAATVVHSIALGFSTSNTVPAMDLAVGAILNAGGVAFTAVGGIITSTGSTAAAQEAAAAQLEQLGIKFLAAVTAPPPQAAFVETLETFHEVLTKLRGAGAPSKLPVSGSGG